MYSRATLRESKSNNAPAMRSPLHLGSSVAKICLRNGQTRTIATHTYKHHATALSVLPSNVDKSSDQFQENARQMGEAMARMQELHKKIEGGGSAKAMEKHIARGKMLPREYVIRAAEYSG